MSRTFVRSKIHQATVTQTDLRYEGSITLDPKLMAAADIAPYEQVHVLNLNTGSRLETYAIQGKPGSGVVCLNGAAARHAEVGDQVIVLTYESFAGAPPKGYAPTVVHVTDRNRVKK
ncbi:MAG TPA: aspartate 1-decarboxylase, partial [bacterium]|nr:aspartate 1-decarboxylase [bacterium]